MPVNNLKEYRTRFGLSQVKLGGISGYSPLLIGAIERGDRKSWPRIRKQLAKVLGVAEAVLFPTEGDDQSAR
ncbi:hypothetical protein ES708_23131 [subsurface metagenome]